MKNNFEEFNDPNTYLIISDYPEETKRYERNWGISWYTKRLTDSLSKNYNVRFVVLAKKGKNNKPKIYNHNVLVLRVFDQKHFSLFPRILKILIKFNRIKKVDVHSEFCATGGVRNFVLLLPFLFLIKISGKKITYFAHNVVMELSSLAPHLGLKKKSFLIKSLNFGLKYYYSLLGLLSNSFVVMDQVIYKRLSKFVNPKKITLYPFWATKYPTYPSFKKARLNLNIKKGELVLLYFGFISYYKGADWLIKIVKKIRSDNQFRNIKLIIAGGIHPLKKDEKYYQTFYQNVIRSVKNEKNISITGFVPEGKISLYFKAADVVILPYRGIIGSSACLSHAISYKKPFIVSRYMKDLLWNQDIASALRKNNVSFEDILFSYNRTSFTKAILRIQNEQFRKRLRNVSRDLAQERNSVKLISNLYNHLYNNQRIPNLLNVRLLPKIAWEK